MLSYRASLLLHVCHYNKVETRMIEGEEHALATMY
jgi:hypothetical protein